MIQVDVKDIVNLSKKLSTASRSTFPVAVRSTLNDMAFDVKKNQLIQVLKNKSGMIIRNESFFKKYSGFQKATGFEISSMYSQVGMIPSGNASKAVNRMATQDEGGSLLHTQVPLYASRRSKSNKKRVQNKAFWEKIKIAKKVKYGDKQGLIRAVTGTGIQRDGGGSPVGIIYGRFLYGIQGFKRFNSKNTIKLHLTKLYEVDKNKERPIKPHRFMQKSATPAGNKMQEIFNANIEKQLKKQGL
jgi:hypothetical protein